MRNTSATFISWFEAAKQCKNYNGTLMSLYSKEENLHLPSYITHKISKETGYTFRKSDVPFLIFIGLVGLKQQNNAKTTTEH